MKLHSKLTVHFLLASTAVTSLTMTATATAYPTKAAAVAPAAVVPMGALLRTVALPISSPATDWTFDAGQYNTDGIADIFAIRTGGTNSGKTEVTVFDGVTGAPLSSVATPLSTVGRARWEFRVGDVNNDRVGDLYAIDRQSTSGRTDLHVIDVRTGRFLVQVSTVLATTQANAWTYAVADGWDRDGRADLHAISFIGAGMGSGTTEWYRTTAASNFQGFDLNTPTALRTTDSTSWTFGIGSFDNDGVNDMYAVSNGATSGTNAELHVVSGATVGQFASQMKLPLNGTSFTNRQFGFADGNNDGSTDIYAITKNGAASGAVEVMVLTGRPADQINSLRASIAAVARAQTGNGYAPYGLKANWCARFATWAYTQAGVTPYGDIISVQTLMDTAIRLGRFKPRTAMPEVGDIAIFKNRQYSHVSIIVSVEGPRSVTTVGGNEGAGGSWSTRQVTLKAGVDPLTNRGGSLAGYASPMPVG